MKRVENKRLSAAALDENMILLCLLVKLVMELMCQRQKDDKDGVEAPHLA